MKNEIASFIKSLILFILFTIVFYIILICLYGNYAPKVLSKNLTYLIGSNGYMNTRIKEAKKVKNIDLLFLGSSHAYRGFDTRIFDSAGIISFNFGSSSQTPIQTELLLKRYFNNLNPKTIVYEVYPATFSSDGVESSLDIISNDKNDLGSLKMAFRLKDIKVLNTLIYGFYRDFLGKNKTFKENTNEGNDRYIKGGFVEKKLMFYSYKNYKTKNKWNLNQDQFYSFEKIINLIKSKGVRLILVQAPITKSLYNSYTNNDEFDKKMIGYAEYYNFNKIMNLDDSLDFYDPHHLNTNGVKLFDEELIEKVFKKN